MKHILCIDPGETTGWAKMTIKGALLEFENLSVDEVFDKLNNYPDPEECLVVIYEEFKVFRKVARQMTGNKMVTSQIIGAVKSFIRNHELHVSVQVPGNKDIGEKWSGMKVPKDHSISHRVDAYNHGFYWLRNNYSIPTALERKAWNVELR